MLATLLPSTSRPATIEKVTVGSQYAAPWLQRFVFGSNYRALWTTPIAVEALDFATEAGGLTVVRRVGGRQTKGLALKGRDGRNYTFRGIEKDASGLLPPDLAGTTAEDIVQDQMSGQHPASELVTRGLLDAVGTPCPNWRLVVLPDDPALGALRETFRGEVGMFAEYPSPVTETNPGFRGITEILNQSELYRRLDAGAGDHIDARAFLRARLVDLMIGDWDRHERQWRWAKFPGSDLWEPIPEDRDQAFSRYQGVALVIGRDRDPRFQNYGPEYPGLDGLCFNGRHQDRRLLAEPTRQDYVDAASFLSSRVTDGVIDSAVAMMPEEWRAIDGSRLAKDLKRRRDGLPLIANRFYEYMARSVDLFLTEQADDVDIQRGPKGEVEIDVRPLERPDPLDDPWFHRVFHSSETRDIRIYALGGDDRFVVRGGRGPIDVRVVGGAGNDTLDDREGGGTKLSDSEGNDIVLRGPKTREDRRPWAPPPPVEPPWLQQQRFGRDGLFTPRIAYRSDVGWEVGGSYESRSYGFRKEPFASHQAFGATYAFGETGIRLDYTGDFRRENRPQVFGLRTFFSTFETLHFYGFGNETVAPDQENFELRERHLLVFPSLARPMGSHAWLVAGPVVRQARTEARDDFVNATHPYGSGTFGQAGAHVALEVSTRDSVNYPRRGFFAGVRGSLWPELWDVESTFGDLNGSLGTYVPLGAAVLALRAGGKEVFGRTTFRDAATIGGGPPEPSVRFDEPGFTLRGFPAERFSGDRAAWGNADLRLELWHPSLLFPCHVGVVGMADAGRVWVSGESSKTWHTSFGGGLWVSPFAYRATLLAYVAHSEEGDFVHFGSGFTF